MQIVFKNENGKIVHGDNIEVMKKIKENSVDSCISDFPYAIEFMNKNWDSVKHWHTGEGSHSEFKGTGYNGKRRPDFYNNTTEDKIKFYDWCYKRAVELYRIMKPGGYVCIFGHHKTNHRMKCAFEDSGFNIIEEIDWIYLTGMPKSQDIGKMFDKKAGKERKVIGTYKRPDRTSRNYENWNDKHFGVGEEKVDRDRVKGNQITEPTTNLAKQWNGWKTAGLKPSHETITVFQKPLEGTYCNNIEKWNCGGMNIDACRVEISQEDIDMLNAKASKNPTTNYSNKEDKVYGKYAEDKASPANPEGRFPPNLVMDEYIAKEFDEQTGNIQSKKGKPRIAKIKNNIPLINSKEVQVNCEYNDSGGGSRIFPIIKYQQKVSPKERKLPNGERNPHVTLKPKELIKWLIKLVTPVNGKTIDITAGSCTHAIAVEELNKDEGYNLKYINIELLNTEEEPYCNVGKMRVESI